MLTDHRHPELEMSFRTLESNQEVLQANQETMSLSLETLSKNQAKIIDLLSGEEHERLGEEPVREGGLVEKVERIDARMSNGGFRLNLPTWTKWAAFLLTVVNIIVGITIIVAAIHGV